MTDSSRQSYRFRFPVEQSLVVLMRLALYRHSWSTLIWKQFMISKQAKNIYRGLNRMRKYKFRGKCVHCSWSRLLLAALCTVSKPLVLPFDCDYKIECDAISYHHHHHWQIMWTQECVFLFIPAIAMHLLVDRRFLNWIKSFPSMRRPSSLFYGFTVECLL